MMRRRLSGRVGVGVLAGFFVLALSSMPATAETDDDAPPADPDAIAATVALYMDEFSNADLDGDGNADFVDTDGDGIPEIPEGEPGDFDLRPGDGRFGTVVEETVAQNAAEYVSDDESSYLLYDCGGMAISYDSDGSMVDWAIGIGSNEGGGPTGQLIDLYPPEDLGKRAFTKSHPFLVKDTVVYFGRMPAEGEGARNHRWNLDTAGISIDEGGDDNPDGNNRNAGEVSVSGDVPGGSFLLPSGIFPVTGDLDSENGIECAGSGWIELDTGNQFLSAPGLVAGAFAIAGILGLLFNSRPAITWKV